MGTYLQVLSALVDSPDTSQVQFFTVQTLFSAAGATTAVFTVTSVLHGFLPKLSPRWFALGFSWVLTFVGISVRHEGWTPTTVLLAVINGFVIYAAAVGINNVSTSAPSPSEIKVAEVEGGQAPRRSYRWWL